jgi:hypothetical protein
MFKNFLYYVAAILGMAWAIGYFVYGIGGVIHILPVLSTVAISLQWIYRKRFVDSPPIPTTYMIQLPLLAANFQPTDKPSDAELTPFSF